MWFLACKEITWYIIIDFSRYYHKWKLFLLHQQAGINVIVAEFDGLSADSEKVYHEYVQKLCQ